MRRIDSEAALAYHRGPSCPSDIFPSRLRAAREIRGLNQRDLAEKAGMQGSAMSHFETGGGKPSFDNLRRLADALDVATDQGSVDDPARHTL
jgi:transcriptional regulator with XRE-family HTH domain